MRSPISDGDPEPAYQYDGRLYRPTAADASAAEKRSPGPFETFDARLVELGVRILASTLLEPPELRIPRSVGFVDCKYDDSDRILKADHARFSVFASEASSEQTLKQALLNNQNAEYDQFDLREKRLRALRESRDMLKAARHASADAWAQILNF